MRVRQYRSLCRLLIGISLCLTLAAPAAIAAGSGARSGPAPDGTLLAAAATSGTKSAPKKRRSKRRYRQPSLSLPAVTPHGIPRLHAKAAYVVDATNHRVLFQKNPERAFPIASLTKLMTAFVFFQTQPEFDRYVTITVQDKRHSSRSHIRAGEEISIRDLIHAALMSSDNVATKALVRTCGVPHDEFIARMNSMADSLGLQGAHFVEPTGLDERNVATASDCAKLLQVASTNPIISAVMQKTSYDFTSNRRRHQLVNTNRLLRSKWRVTAGKTGFIHEAGYCLATNVETAAGTEITAVLLGAPSNTMRFAEARRLLDWSYRFGLAASDNPGDD
jgi:D-alanyl-D-alanine endopeptidase (penicillin-binding protein 7)